MKIRVPSSVLLELVFFLASALLKEEMGSSDSRGDSENLNSLSSGEEDNGNQGNATENQLLHELEQEILELVVGCQLDESIVAAEDGGELGITADKAQDFSSAPVIDALAGVETKWLEGVNNEVVPVGEKVESLARLHKEGYIHIGMDIALEILDKLLIRKAVASSLLSKRWSNYWRLMPHLQLDRSLSSDAIDSILRLHSGPIRNLILATDHIEHADRWVVAISRRAEYLNSLSLSFTHNYRLHHALFSIRQYLTELWLSQCFLSLPTTSWRLFPVLKTLGLSGILFSNENQLSVLVMGCPLLQRLHLFMNVPTGRLIITNQDLSELTIISDDCIGFDTGRKQMINNLTLALSSNPDIQLDLSGLFNSVECKNFLNLFYSTIERTDKYLPNTFMSLQTLQLSISLVDKDHISLMLYIMRRALNLKQLTVYGMHSDMPSYKDDEVGPGIDFWDARYSIDLFGKLEILEVSGFWFQEPEMIFLKFVIARACALRTLRISNCTPTLLHERALIELDQVDKASPEFEITKEFKDMEDES